MDEERPLEKQRCAAMVDAGVYDPESKDGIDFCVNYCPYDHCVVLEHRRTASQLRRSERACFAQKLWRHRVSVDDIALILGVSARNVRRYLKK